LHLAKVKEIPHLSSPKEEGNGEDFLGNKKKKFMQPAIE
jgi:hypothetical protein